MNPNIFNKYYEEKHYLKDNDQADKFDIIIDENKCSKFRETGVLCEKCFNYAVIEKMQEFSSLERLNFINYQLNKYTDPLDWLRRTHALLNDNDDEFRSFNYKMYLEYQQMIETGITQFLESKDTKNQRKKQNHDEFVNVSRIDELRSISNPNFDFSKLISYCEEVNICYQNECYLAVAMLIRAIIDHIPPIFHANDFQNVYSQHGTKSFKEQMTHLDKSSRKIADSYLHGHMRNKESLPNQTQVNFSQDIDVLLAEICRQTK